MFKVDSGDDGNLLLNLACEHLRSTKTEITISNIKETMLRIGEIFEVKLCPERLDYIIDQLY